MRREQCVAAIAALCRPEAALFQKTNNLSKDNLSKTNNLSKKRARQTLPSGGLGVCSVRVLLSYLGCGACASGISGAFAGGVAGAASAVFNDLYGLGDAVGCERVFGYSVLSVAATGCEGDSNYGCNGKNQLFHFYFTF